MEISAQLGRIQERRTGIEDPVNDALVGYMLHELMTRDDSARALLEVVDEISCLMENSAASIFGAGTSQEARSAVGLAPRETKALYLETGGKTKLTFCR